MEKKKEFELKKTDFGLYTRFWGESEPILEEFIDAKIRARERELRARRDEILWL